MTEGGHNAADNAAFFRRHAPLGRLLAGAFGNGFFTTGQAGAFAVYLPELYPTRARTPPTGIGFIFNVGRYVVVLGPLYAAVLIVTLGGIRAGL